MNIISRTVAPFPSVLFYTCDGVVWISVPRETVSLRSSHGKRRGGGRPRLGPGPGQGQAARHRRPVSDEMELLDLAAPGSGHKGAEGPEEGRLARRRGEERGDREGTEALDRTSFGKRQSGASEKKNQPKNEQHYHHSSDQI